MCDRSSVTFDLRQCVSPRVRGNPASRFICDTRSRSIPACAGEPSSVPTCHAPQWVYPRVCGGTIQRPDLPCSAVGLSPRVRGNHPASRPAMLRSGSIPACAGEPEWADATGGGGLGLSPRVRGNHSAPLKIRRPSGSIPACAGEPATLPVVSVSSAVYPRVCGGT